MTKFTADMARMVAVDLLSQETDRDRQRKVGASNISNPCTYCLARDMVGMLYEVPEVPRGKYFMGSVIGTAIHNLLEERANLDDDYVAEQRVVIGEIPGYGEIKSTTDLYIKSRKASIDWKTTTRDKLKWLQMVPGSEPTEYDFSDLVAARYKIQTYLAQLNLYGLGLENAGLEVETVSIVFVARDAKTVGTQDVWAHTVPYQRDMAHKAFDRTKKIWQALQEGKVLDTFKSNPLCYTCGVGGRV